MKEHTEQQLDKLVKKAMMSASVKSPSIDFISNLMKEIEHVYIGETTTYKPLISKYGWFVIIAILIGVSLYVMLGNVEESSFLEAIDYSIISNNKLTNVFSGFKFSKVVT